MLLFLCLVGTLLELAQTHLSPLAGERARTNYQEIGEKDGKDAAFNSSSNRGYNSLPEPAAVNSRSNDERVPLLFMEPKKPSTIDPAWLLWYLRADTIILLCFSLI